MEDLQVASVIQQKDLALVGVMAIPDRPGIAAAIFKALGTRGINVQFIVQCVDLSKRSHVVLCVASKHLATALGVLEPVKARIGAQQLIHIPQVGVVITYGPEFREQPGVAAKVGAALAAAEINILAISTSFSTVSCVVAGEHLDDAVRALKNAFEVS
jgi:aspartate kinase